MVVLSAKSFVKKIYNVQGFNIRLPMGVRKVILKNDSIITHKTPDNWSVDQFKEYLKSFIVDYNYK